MKEFFDTSMLVAAF
jgi:predicted nucleic acid-binding protein